AGQHQWRRARLGRPGRPQPLLARWRQLAAGTRSGRAVMNDPRDQDQAAGGPGASERKRAFDADGVRTDDATAERLLREARRDQQGGGTVDSPDDERNEARDRLDGLGGSG